MSFGQDRKDRRLPLRVFVFFYTYETFRTKGARSGDSPSVYRIECRSAGGGRHVEEAEETLYEPFQTMLDANLDLPSDYSETYGR